LLLHIQFVRILADARAQGVAFGPGRFDSRGNLSPLPHDPARKVFGEA
jgi:hypothetical protein